MITARHVVAAGLAGVLIGTTAAASPAGAAAVVVLAALIWRVARGLSGVERRWVLAWLILAVAVRVIAVCALPLTADPRRESFATIFGGDASYAIQRSIWIANAFVRAPFAPRDAFEAFQTAYGWSGYNYAMALLHVFFGPSPYAVHLVSTILFVAAIGVLFRRVRASHGPAEAFFGLAVLTIVPSLFLWSIAPLKDEAISMLAACAIAATFSLLQPRRWWHIPAAALGVVSALLAVWIVRAEFAVMIAAALAAGVIGWMALRHRRIAALCAVAAVVGSLAVAMGAIPRANALAARAVAEAARRHMGNASAPGHSFALLDADAYAWKSGRTDGAGSMTRFVIRATVRFFSVPEPWILKPGFEMWIIPQQMAWYALLIVSGLGVVVGVRRDPLLTSLLSAFVAVSALAIGAYSGNIGTLLRHRDIVVPFAVWLSAAGSVRALAAVPKKRVNSLDAGVAAMPLALTAAGFALFLLFRAPTPKLESVTPGSLSSPGEVVLRGDGLRPFLRAYVSTGAPIRISEMGTPFPQVEYLARNRNEALLKLPALSPGTYDLALFDRSDQVAVLRRAFTVTRMATDPVCVVVVGGRLTGVDEVLGRALVPGAVIRTMEGTTILEVLRVGADRPQLRSTGPGSTATWMRIEGQSERPATIRMHCQFKDNIPSFAGRRVVAGQDLMLPFPAGTVQFSMDVVVPDDPNWPLTGGPVKDAVVDFIGWPGAQAHATPGTRDAGPPFDHPGRPSEIVRIVAVEPFVGDATLNGASPGERMFSQQPLVRIRAIVRYPLLPSGEVEQRGRPVGLGSPVEFESPDVLLRGTITSFVASREARRP